MQNTRKIPEIKDIKNFKLTEKLDQVSLHDQMWKGQKTNAPKKNSNNSHKTKKAWYIKVSSNDEHLTEVIAADFLLNFSKKIPKYRFTQPDENGKTYILSQAVGYDKLSEGYLKVESLQHYIESGKNLTEDIKKDLLKMYAINALAGNVDLHSKNLLIVNDKEIHSIDFGLAFLDFKNNNKTLLYGIFNYDGVIVKSEAGQTLKEVATQKELFEATKEVIQEYKSRENEIIERLTKVCHSLRVKEKADEIIGRIKGNIEFIERKIAVYKLIEENKNQLYDGNQIKQAELMKLFNKNKIPDPQKLSKEIKSEIDGRKNDLDEGKKGLAI